MWFLIQMLGIGKSIQNFILAHWKIILPVLLLVGLIIYHKIAVSNAYDLGKQEERAEWVAKVEAENNRNKHLESQIDIWKQKYRSALKQRNTERNTREQIVSNKIKELIKNNKKYQSCTVDNEIVEDLNNLRNEGP